MTVIAEGRKDIPRSERAMQILRDTGAVLTGDHFLYKSGRHGDVYINKDAVYPHTEETRELASMWAENFKDSGIEVVVGPALGGIILSHDTASSLTQITGREIHGVYAEKKVDEKGKEYFAFTRGYDQLVAGKKVLVVEDVLTTGASVKSVVDLVRETGGEVLAVGAIANRGGVTPEDIGVERLDALVDLNLPTYAPDDCPMCANGTPINRNLGHGKNLPK